MDTKSIQKIVGKVMTLRGHSPVCENVSHLLLGEVDIFSLNASGYTCEFEVKISRGDFKRDAKKSKFRNFELAISGHNFNGDFANNIPNYFTYVCPENLIQPEEIHEHYGFDIRSFGGIGGD